MESSSRDRIWREQIEQMVLLRQSMDEARDKLGEIKREGRADGLNMDAVNALLPVLSQHPHDKGARVLLQMIRYAELVGAELNTLTQHSISVSEAEAPLGPQTDVAGVQSGSAAASRQKSRILTRLRLSSQVVAAVSLSIGLIWLLN